MKNNNVDAPNWPKSSIFKIFRHNTVDSESNPPSFTKGIVLVIMSIARV